MNSTTSTAVDTAAHAVNTTAPAAATLSSMSVLSSVGTAFLVVLCLILFLAWAVKRSGFKKFTSDLINVRSSYALSAKERIVLIEVANQLLVVGITSQTMTLLHTVDPETSRMVLDAANQETSTTGVTHRFAELLQSALKRGNSQ